MDIKELNKTQLILLTLLITFVVSIATGIITVSLMQQMPKSVPQTINNVIQRTIEKVSVPVAPEKTPATNTPIPGKDVLELGASDGVISIYNINAIIPAATAGDTNTNIPLESRPLGQGIIISDMGLVLVDSKIVDDAETFKVVLDKTEFEASIVKKFDNGFTILKISPKKTSPETPTTPISGN